MALTILDSATAAAVLAATSQSTQIAALIAPWASGVVTARVMQGSTLRATNTHSPWVLNAASQRGAVLGARQARTFVTAGAPDRIVFRAGSTDIFQITADTAAGADYVFAATITEPCAERLDGLTIKANPLLPATISVPMRLTLSGTGTVGTPASGVVFNDGSSTAAFSLAGAGLTVTPAVGTIVAGGQAPFTVSATAAATYSLTLTNGSGGAVGGSPASITFAAAPVSNPSGPATLGRGWHLVTVEGYDAAGYDAIAATGANTVRHAVNLTVSGSTYVIGSGAMAEVTAQVALARARGITFVLTLAPPANTTDALWSDTGLQASLASIWQGFALQFRGISSIAFDLVNEPNAPTQAACRALQQTLIDAVRAVDSGRTLVVSFNVYSLPGYFAGQAPFSASNLVYTVHAYDPHEYTHQGIGSLPTPVSYTPGSLAAILAPARAFQIANNVPIYCGEFSVNRIAPGRLQYLTELTGLFEAYGWSWTYHAWREYSGWDSQMNSDPADFTRRTTEPTYQLLSGLMATAPVATGSTFTSINVTREATGAVGSGAYTATILPLQGLVPSGASVVSTDDPTMRASIVSTYPADGSAAVIVVSGQQTLSAGQTKVLTIQPGTVSAVAMTPASIGAILSSVSVNFGTAASGTFVPTYGDARITDFSTPERIMWANARTICARYRKQPPTLAGSALEVVIDVHAFSNGTARVEFTVENGKMNSATPVKPAWAGYTDAVVSINGTTIKTVDSAGAAEGAHSNFRAWFAEGWVGGNPGLLATQSAADLQKHPLFWKPDQANTASLTGYAADTYTPWGAGRHRGTNMGGQGDHPSIGPLPQWEAHFLTTGDARAANAVRCSALSILGFNVNYRDAATGLVPDASMLAGKHQSGGGGGIIWPTQTNAQDAMMWETAHHPAAGLMAFVCRPSPVFIEIAQKIAVWNGTFNCDPDGLRYGWDGPSFGVTDMTGMFGPSCQMRGKAWGIRSLSHATFLSPTGSSWKTGGQVWLDKNRRYLGSWKSNTKAKLNVIWNDATNLPVDTDGGPGFGISMAAWQYAFIVGEMHRAASAKHFSGSAQTEMDLMADWCATYPIRWVTEQPDGGWRYADTYRTLISTSMSDITGVNTWEEMQAYRFQGGHPASVAGPWAAGGVGNERSYAALDAQGAVTTAGSNYLTQFWSALVAGVERRVPGSAAAWNTVQNNVTNLAAWKASGSSDPRWLSTTRVSVSPGFATGSDAGSVVNHVWIPGKTAGVVNAVSWESVPKGRWISVAGSRLDALDAEVKAAVPGWASYNRLSWDGTMKAWNGFAIDQPGSRVWLVAAGGHSDSPNNGIYRFECATMAWAVEHMPSDPTPWNVDYRNLQNGVNTYTTHPTSLALWQSKLAAGTLQPVNDVFYDELPEDHAPTSRHVYSGAVYDPLRDQLLVHCRRTWRYSRQAQQWIERRFTNDMVDGSYGGGENMTATYDEVTGQSLVNYQGGSNYKSIAFNHANSTWAGWSCPWREKNVGDARHGRLWTAFAPPTNDGPYAPLGDYWRYNLDTRTTEVSGTVQMIGGFSQQSFTRDLFDGSALVYIPEINRYWGISRSVNGAGVWFELDPTVSPWTMGPLTFTPGADITLPDGVIIERKLVYFPELKALILGRTGSTNMLVYRF